MSMKWALVLVKAVVSAGLIAYLVDRSDMAAVLERIGSIGWTGVAGFLALMLVQVGAAAARWRVVQQALGAAVPYGLLARFFYIGMFFNQALPGGVGGDAMRVFMMTTAGHRAGRAFSGVLLDRIAAVAGLVLLLAVATPFLIGHVDAVAGRLAMALAGAAVAGLAVCLALLLAPWRLPDWLAGFAPVRGLLGIADDARALFLTPATAAPVLLWALFGHVVTAGYFFLVARAMDLPVQFVDCAALMPLVLLATLVPVSIGGWGVRETAMIAVFGWVGVATESALALSITLGGLVLAASLPGGLVWLFGRGRGASSG